MAKIKSAFEFDDLNGVCIFIRPIELDVRELLDEVWALHSAIAACVIKTYVSQARLRLPVWSI